MNVVHDPQGDWENIQNKQLQHQQQQQHILTRKTFQ